jgi:hypothetical protein
MANFKRSEPAISPIKGAVVAAFGIWPWSCCRPAAWTGARGMKPNPMNRNAQTRKMFLFIVTKPPIIFSTALKKPKRIWLRVNIREYPVEFGQKQMKFIASGFFFTNILVNIHMV